MTIHPAHLAMSGPSSRINAIASSSKPTFSHRENHSRATHALTVRRPSSLRESRSADDLAEDSEHELEQDQRAERERERERLSVNVDLDVETSRCAGPERKWSPEDSPVSDSSSDFDYEFDFDGTPGNGVRAAGRSCAIDIDTSGPTSISLSPPSPKIKSSAPSITHPYRRPQRGLAPLSSLPAPPPCANGVLPKSQPLARALFARMTDAPHAGMGLLGVGSAGKKAGQGKQKMIVATKPMRTTFELGLTASELARRA